MQVEQMQQVKLLEVLLVTMLFAIAHTDSIIATTNQHLYLLSWEGLALTHWMRRFFCYRPIGREFFYIPSPGMEFLFHIYYLVQIFFFDTHVSRAENWSSAPIYSTG